MSSGGWTDWINTREGSRIRVDRPEWYFEPPDAHGEVCVFGPQGYAQFNFRDVSSVILVEVPPPPPINGEAGS
jgi:hypothetical protein